ncbi:MAG: type II secretion system F family protein [candidate division KSB1 bacterium]
MTEFRYQGVTLTGKPLRGTVLAPNRFEAKRKTEKINQQHGLRQLTLHARVPFGYAVRKGQNGKVQRGEIQAYTREEVYQALTRQGYQILKLRQKFFRPKLAVPQKELVFFVRMCADLLREKYPYEQILALSIKSVENRTLRETIQEIHQDLIKGKEGRQVFLKHSQVLGKFAAYMMSVASTSGNMAEIYSSLAKFLERSADFRKNIRSALFMPIVVMLACLGALSFYVMYLFPEIARLLLKFKIKIPPMTAAALSASEFLQNNYVWLALAFALPASALFVFLRSTKGRLLWHRLMLSLPLVGSLFYKTSVEIFARFFHSLYSGAGENIEVLQMAAESCRNTYLEKKIKEQVLPMMLREGRSLTEALEKFEVFPPEAVASLRAGEESGTLGEAALSLANYYETETKYKMARIIDLINVTMAIVVSLLISLITLLSSEIGFVAPPNPLVK